jgi:diguanylate cyclase (GGDEF)-like protein
MIGGYPKMQNKILVVEDDCTASELYLAILTRSGFNTKAADSAEEAIKILENEDMNIILTDIKLPGMDGIQFTKKIRKKCNTDVIVMTGYSAEYTYEDAIKSGASDLIFKPVKLNELLLRINRVIRERSLLNQQEKLIKKLQRLTIEDQLTGLYNSRHLFDQLDKEINRADRYFYSISLMFIDVDNFKSINDTYGHMIGDKILSLSGQRIKACLRSSDTAYRFAGDEFTILLPETKLSEAKIVADRILAEFAQDSLTIDENEITKFTLSIGIAEYQRKEGLEQFLHRADIIMYEAKKCEGNSVSLSPELEEISVTNLSQLSHSCYNP